MRGNTSANGGAALFRDIGRNAQTNGSATGPEETAGSIHDPVHRGHLLSPSNAPDNGSAALHGHDLPGREDGIASPPTRATDLFNPAHHGQ